MRWGTRIRRHTVYVGYFDGQAAVRKHSRFQYICRYIITSLLLCVLGLVKVLGGFTPTKKQPSGVDLRDGIQRVVLYVDEVMVSVTGVTN